MREKLDKQYHKLAYLVGFQAGDEVYKSPRVEDFDSKIMETYSSFVEKLVRGHYAQLRASKEEIDDSIYATYNQGFLDGYRNIEPAFDDPTDPILEVIDKANHIELPTDELERFMDRLVIAQSPRTNALYIGIPKSGNQDGSIILQTSRDLLSIPGIAYLIEAVEKGYIRLKEPDGGQKDA